MTLGDILTFSHRTHQTLPWSIQHSLRCVVLNLRPQRYGAWMCGTISLLLGVAVDKLRYRAYLCTLFHVQRFFVHVPMYRYMCLCTEALCTCAKILCAHVQRYFVPMYRGTLCPCTEVLCAHVQRYFVPMYRGSLCPCTEALCTCVYVQRFFVLMCRELRLSLCSFR